MQLLIMAAGMGKRFGEEDGAKQTCEIGPNKEWIIDYSIYDAIKAGFSKVIFIIREEFYNNFKDKIGSRVEKYIPVEYAFQRMENVPDFVNIPKDRKKPWGTAQAIYCAKDKITEPFVVINADDFYGRGAFMTARDFLMQERENKFSTVGYKAANTMTENGSVKRGVITAENGNLKSIIESKLKYVNGDIIASPLEGGEDFKVEKDALVSMNMLTFDLSVFPFIEKQMDTFFKKNKDNLEDCEFLIPVELNKAVKEGKEVKVLNTDATWYGITYPEDVPQVKEAIKKLTFENEYPKKLWN